MQKIVLVGTEKITLLEQIVSEYEDTMDNLKRKNEEIETKLKDMDLKMQDFNIAELLKENAKMGDENGGEGNNLLLNLVSNLEKKFNSKSKITDERLNKIEETNFKLVKDSQNLKNAQDGNKRSIKSLKQANDDLLSNMQNLEKIVSETVPDISQKLETQIKNIKKEKEEKDDASKSEKKERKNSYLSISQHEPQIDLENNEKIKEIMKRIADLEKDVKKLPGQLGVEQIKSGLH